MFFRDEKRDVVVDANNEDSKARILDRNLEYIIIYARNTHMYIYICIDIYIYIQMLGWDGMFKSCVSVC